MQAGIRTANAVKPMTEVMNHAQALSGKRISDMPLCAHVEGSSDEVQRTEQLADAKNGDRSSPENYA